MGAHKGYPNEDYYALLQTGIKVPVNKEIYDAWKQGWDKESYSGDTDVYEL